MLKVSGLHASYGRIPILNGIDFAVAQGEVAGILGHNGMGKTTLMRALMGFVPADRGRVEMEGRDRPLLSLSSPTRVTIRCLVRATSPGNQ